MRQITLFILLFFSGLAIYSQDDENPVKWVTEWNKISESEYELTLKADIFEGWHIYSQYTKEGGSLPSEFTYKKVGEDYELIGKTEESETVTEYSDIFEVDETFFKKDAVFTVKKHGDRSSSFLKGSGLFIPRWMRPACSKQVNELLLCFYI